MYANGDINLEPIPAYAAMLAKTGLRACSSTVLPAKAICLPPMSGKKVAEAWVKAAPEDF